MNKVILKVGKKGVVILPKRLREALNVGEGDELLAEASAGAIVLKPLKPKVVNVDPALVKGLLAEEKELEERRYWKPIEEASPGR